MSVERASRANDSRGLPRVFRLRTTLRLPRLTALKLGLSAPTAPGICRVESPDGRFDLDDVGAEIGEQHRAERPGHHLRDVEHAQAVERSAA